MQTTSATQTSGKLIRYARRALVLLVVLLVVLYAAIAALAANVVTTPRRAPVSTTPAAAGLQYQDVQFPAATGDATIAGWYIPAENAKRAVVLVHGKDSNRATAFAGRFVELAAALHQRGFTVLMIDLRGHGESSAARFTFGLYERRDVIGAVAYLQSKQPLAPGNIGVLGVSMGAAAGIGALHDDSTIGALVADCSYAEVYPLMQMHWSEASRLPEFFLPGALLAGRMLTGVDLVQARPVAEVGKIEQPVLIIHGDADSFTPIEQGRQLAAAAPQAEYWEVPGADHSRAYATNPSAYIERVVAFFEQALG
jgi:uncharacterized protein